MTQGHNTSTIHLLRTDRRTRDKWQWYHRRLQQSCN